MAPFSLAFKMPDRAPFSRSRLRAAVLLVCTAGWLLLYAWLSWRLLAEGQTLGRPTNLLLTLACLVLGTAVVFGWRSTWPDWRSWLRRLTPPSAGRALSLEELQAMPPFAFEAYVGERLFARRGYRVQNVRDVKDRGVDLVVFGPDDRKGIVQCKRYKGVVGEPIVRDLFGTLIHNHADTAYLVVTSYFSDEAREWASDKPIELIDGPELVRLAAD